MILDNTLAIVFGIASIAIPIITALVLGRRSTNLSIDLEQYACPNPREYMMMEEIYSVHRWNTRREEGGRMGHGQGGP